MSAWSDDEACLNLVCVGVGVGQDEVSASLGSPLKQTCTLTSSRVKSAANV